MKSLVLGVAAAGLLTGGITLAQATQGTGPAGPAATITPASPRAPAGTGGSAGTMHRDTGTAAASGNTNQAVATTGVNAPTPAKGGNATTVWLDYKGNTGEGK